jgi:hypothetical protein
MLNCADKWLLASQRVSRVFVEQQWLDAQERDDLDGRT